MAVESFVGWPFVKARWEALAMPYRLVVLLVLLMLSTMLPDSAPPSLRSPLPPGPPILFLLQLSVVDLNSYDPQDQPLP